MLVVLCFQCFTVRVLTAWRGFVDTVIVAVDGDANPNPTGE